MKFVVIADSHGQHRQLRLPKGDVIIHAGDVSRRGEEIEIIDFLNWFSALDYRLPDKDTLFSNASVLDENYKLKNDPVTFEA